MSNYGNWSLRYYAQGSWSRLATSLTLTAIAQQVADLHQEHGVMGDMPKYTWFYFFSRLKNEYPNMVGATHDQPFSFGPARRVELWPAP